MKFPIHLGYALGLFWVICPISTTTASTVFELRREQAIESVIQGCTRAIEDSAVVAYVKRRADAGNPVASVDEARAEIESTEWWRGQMLPALRRDCSCVLGSYLSEMRNARTDDELDAAVAKLGEEMQTPSAIEELETKAPSCLSLGPKG